MARVIITVEHAGVGDVRIEQNVEADTLGANPIPALMDALDEVVLRVNRAYDLRNNK